MASQLNAEQLQQVLFKIAGAADSASALLGDLSTELEPSTGRRAFGALYLIEYIGALADFAIDDEAIGSIGDWAMGPGFGSPTTRAT